MLIPKPSPSEYEPAAIAYIKLVPDDGDVLRHLAENCRRISDYVRSMPGHKLSAPHAPGEWTVKDILAHLIDSERVFAYRALRIGRGDKTELPGYPHEEYVSAAMANRRSLGDILDEYASARGATLSLIRSFDSGALIRSAVCNGHRTTVRALVYDIAGHELHHLYSIQENYG